MIQLTRQGVAFTGSAADLRALRAQFQRDHYIILPKLVEPDLLTMILKRIELAPTVQKEHGGITTQAVIDDPLTYNLCLFLVSMPEFQKLIQRIAGCRRISNFKGRIYTLNPATSQQILWHADVHDHRLVTLSLNLTTREYHGGALQIRLRGSEEILHEVRNTGLGDALLMRVANKLEHRVLPVEGDVPRTALAGWFRWEKGNENFHHAVRTASQSFPEQQAIAQTETVSAAARRE